MNLNYVRVNQSFQSLWFGNRDYVTRFFKSCFESFTKLLGFDPWSSMRLLHRIGVVNYLSSTIMTTNLWGIVSCNAIMLYWLSLIYFQWRLTNHKCLQILQVDKFFVLFIYLFLFWIWFLQFRFAELLFAFACQKSATFILFLEIHLA